MTEATQSLLPCPFCGSEKIDPTGWRSLDAQGPACDDCGASAGQISLDHAENITAWNTRSQSHSLPGDVGMQEALKPFADKAAMCDFGDDDYCPDWSPFIPVGAYRKAAAALTPSPCPGDVGMREALERIADATRYVDNVYAKTAHRIATAALTPSALSGDAGEGELVTALRKYSHSKILTTDLRRVLTAAANALGAK